ncbi:asparagine synthase (glutamine-hydrolyzing) [Legionella pneumophila serogroup 1]|uniref:asparagine synthase (glutamine-hydrolyzing) n=1 Tax=Legionella pneumophila TaxID=446 RepID=UPI001A1C4F78|nr:asparagine synthase (glutamine-hydrolyzing) [Legionella pneumophila]BCZ97567.1 asparagine synthetase B [Legionella pneumophila]HAU0941388.1 asparagine synthase (glutamine-hydrolyzing) [Legionella pneumophila]HDO7873397.1 asparagine synthase (glutamine-hydrolyzing) [Legionella pneumophila]HDO7941131.1 asparagine synthase (glutamine-hydrolyzing) [Legionella pneumophila]HDO8158930.1 asparagine synthase (glutamine-hydrolyzing) [Legionella pneumophila]
MCGVVGIFSHKAIDPEQVVQATKALAHRGPDGYKIWRSKTGRVALGHHRLSINDKINGDQPMVDNKIVISVNGELYDYTPLKTQLISLGYNFKTNSDSELVLHLYHAYGLDFVNYLRGEFAIIIYDMIANKIIIARDRFGIKPMCYYLKDGVFYCASEAKAIFAAGVAIKWDLQSLEQSFSFQYLSADQTLFSGIKQLEPGKLLVYDGYKLIKHTYWDINYHNNQIERPSFEDYTSLILNELKDSIQQRLRSGEKKICCHLSGGLDSSAIASLANQYVGNTLPCFTLSFDNPLYDETEQAKAVADHIGVDIQVVSITVEHMLSVLEDAIFYSEGTAINNHLSAKYILNQKIKQQGFEIVLSGEGSDELFYGYNHLACDFDPENFKKETINTITRGIHFGDEQEIDLSIIQNKIGMIPTFVRAKASIGMKISALMNKQDRMASILNQIFSNEIINPIANFTPLQKSTYLWSKFALAGYILRTLGDGTEMAHGVEGRVPFLDHKLFDLVSSMPAEYNFRHGLEKYALRQAVKKFIPPSTFYRKKQPLLAPPLFLMTPKGIDFILDCVNDLAFQSLPYLSQPKVKNYFESIKNMDFNQKVAAEPVVMLIITSYLLMKRFKLT